MGQQNKPLRRGKNCPNLTGMKDIYVTPAAAHPHHGILRFGTHRSRCALGRAGLTKNKQEGDGKTPIGRFKLRRIWYRPDRIIPPQSTLPIVQISQKSGWCDDDTSSLYNRPIMRPCAARHELLWRRDRLYDVFFELGINDAPPEKGRGSALFLHLEKNNFQPTLGCIAVSHASMSFLLRHAGPASHIIIGGR
jgi:L,D-peptidoglycan transpeptidase YkuD (ErfK/YbiS/YcfS/YnhG family)